MNLAFYLVKVGKLYKFGFTNKPVREKVSALQRSYSEKVELVSSFPTSNGSKNEDYFNEKLAAYKVGGDWFNLPRQLIDCKKDWFKSCVAEPATIPTKGFKPEPKPKEVQPLRLLPPLPPFPEMESFNELLANGSENFIEEFGKRYSAMMEAAKNLAPEEFDAHNDNHARATMGEAEYNKYAKDMATLRKRAADRQNRN